MTRIPIGTLSAALLAGTVALGIALPAAAGDGRRHKDLHRHHHAHDHHHRLHRHHYYPYAYGYVAPYVWGYYGGVIVRTDPNRDTSSDGWRHTDGRYQ